MDPYSNASSRIEEFLNHPDAPEKTKTKLRQSIEVVREAFKEYKEDELALSFNGGKDCLVMLYVILASASRPLQTVYIRNHDTFPEVDDFVDACAQKYGLNVEISTKPMKDALESYLDAHKHIKAIFVGIRRGDPWSEHLKYIQPTDHGWPDFIRVHPVLDWDYDDVWHFIRVLKIEYCSLYDLGYTSLGGTTSTVRNPSLKRPDGSYAKAYKLEDPSLERIGRNVTSK